MEQRAEPRINVANATAEVTVDVLGDDARRVTAQLVDVSSRGMRIATREPLAADTALRICLDGDQYLGEVTHWSRDGDRFLVGVSLFNVMRNVAEVTERLGRLLATR